jgi:hypothetical protein
MGGLYAEYGICIFINQKIGIDNIFLNGSLLGIVEVCGYVLIFFFANRVGRRQINIHSNIYKLAGSVALVVMDSIHNEMYHGVKKAMWFQVTETSIFYFFNNFWFCFFLKTEKKIFIFIIHNINFSLKKKTLSTNTILTLNTHKTNNKQFP